MSECIVLVARRNTIHASETISKEEASAPANTGKTKVWVAQWWQDGNGRSPRCLAAAPTMGKSEAEAAHGRDPQAAERGRRPGSKARVYLWCLPRTGIPADVPPKVEGVHSNDN